ncbi:helix-turn-helix domain-containing protein [Streptomyces syringium]|uniref:helix-turn-helix domain-containing protein n=1 Tax=Streptomyces syringium TaxID=76729 RepID=UPI0034041F63
MRVHRTQHTHAFTIVPNSAARHAKLSLAARGLLLTLLSLPDGTRVTVETITEGVEEGRQAVSKAFNALVSAGYLRRERGQDPETGLWCTQTHVSDLPMDHIPAVGTPKGRTLGDSPKGESTKGKNLLPVTHGETSTEAEAEEDGESPKGDHKPETPADAVAGRAAAVLAKLGNSDRRLALGAADILRLAPLAAEWLTEGHRELKLLTVLTTRLPERIDAPAALVQYRLKNHRPAKPEPRKAPAPDTRACCPSCGAPFRAGVERELCQQCTDEMAQAVTRLATDEPNAEPASVESQSPASVSAEAAELLASIRQRRVNGDFAPGAKSRFLATA